jgi:FG-GAP-like repeat
MTIKRNLLRNILALVAAVTLVTGSGCGGDSTPSDGAESLGVNTDLGPRQNPDGEELDEEYHPFSKTYRTIAPLAELYFAGMVIGETNQGLLDDEKADFAELYTEDDAAWTELRTVGGKGDLDGDGFDEIAVVYYVPADSVLKLKVIDRADGSYSETNTTVLVGLEPVDDSGFPTPMSLATGDLDGDGRDEIAVSYGNTVYLLDDAQAGHTLLSSVTYPADAVAEISYISLTFGDFNGDGLQQLFVLHSQYGDENGWVAYHRYDTSLDTESAGDQLIIRVDLATHVPFLANAVAGDVDGDGLDEIALRAWSPDGIFTTILDDQRQAFVQRVARPAATIGLMLAVLDADGDGVGDVLSGNELLGYSNNTQELSVKGSVGSVLAFPFGNSLFGTVAVGDFNADFKQDVALFDNGSIRIFGMDLDGNFVQRQALAAASNGAQWPILVAANVDNDSLVVKYNGDHELLFTKPQVLAVMAAPPAYAGRNVEGSSTTFGRMSGSETEATKAHGFTAGVSLGYEHEGAVFGIKISGFEVKASVEMAMDWTSTTSSSQETSVAFTSGSGEDKVIFTAIPYDVYYYEVVSAPDASMVGTMISISVPREPQTMSVSRTYYNAHNGDAMDIDETVLGHEIGNPWSYPTATERQALMAGGGWINEEAQLVGEGTGETTLTISVTEGKGTGQSLDIDAKIETEVSAGGVKAGVSAGFHYGHEYSAHAYEGLFLEGTIADIPGDAERYKAGIFGYSHTATNGQTFIVVNYWVTE